MRRRKKLWKGRFGHLTGLWGRKLAVLRVFARGKEQGKRLSDYVCPCRWTRKSLHIRQCYVSLLSMSAFPVARTAKLRHRQWRWVFFGCHLGYRAPSTRWSIEAHGLSQLSTPVFSNHRLDPELKVSLCLSKAWRSVIVDGAGLPSLLVISNGADKRRDDDRVISECMYRSSSCTLVITAAASRDEEELASCSLLRVGRR